MSKTLALALLLALALPAAARGPKPDADRTLSPYFLVSGEDAAAGKLPLLATEAEVDIAGVIADVRVTQRYHNAGPKPIEAVYIFPASTRAAVYGMKMTIGERVIVAEVQRRGQAREHYEQALREGRSASLLEQQRPNVFQMNVGNILPGDTILVELSYTELLVPTDGVYEFVYPTVVGPRYSEKPAGGAPAGDRWVENPYLREGEPAPYHFDIGVRLAAGLAIAEMTCPSHKTGINYQGPATATCRLDPAERNGGNRDFILRYRLAGGKVESGLLLFPGEKENFFLAMVQPPRRVAREDIPGREYIFIVDVSGSMYGFPLEISKKLLRDLITGLRPTDRFNVLLFASGFATLADNSLAANEANVARAVRFIDEQRGSGGTRLLPALEAAFALPRVKGTSRSILIVTDGLIDVEPEAFDLIRRSLGDANVFTFGIGSSINRHLLEGMARVGLGEQFVITTPDAAPAAAERFRRYVATPVLTGVRLRFEGFDAYDVEPAGVPDVMADRPVVVFGKYRGRAAGRVIVTGRGGRGEYRQVLEVGRFTPGAKNAALRQLWARHRITLLDDYNSLRADDRRVEEVTALGLAYNLLTRYTSFVAIDTEVRTEGGRPVVVRQPLPLPEGVSDYAVGYHAGTIGMALPSVKAYRGRGLTEPSPAVVTETEEDRGGKVSIVEVKVSGIAGAATLAAEARRAVEAVLAELEAAYAAELGRDPNLSGTLTARLTIGPDGRVSKVEFPQPALKRPLRTAVERVLKALTVNRAPGPIATATVKLRFGN